MGSCSCWRDSSQVKSEYVYPPINPNSSKNNSATQSQEKDNQLRLSVIEKEEQTQQIFVFESQVKSPHPNNKSAASNISNDRKSSDPSIPVNERRKSKIEGLCVATEEAKEEITPSLDLSTDSPPVIVFPVPGSKDLVVYNFTTDNRLVTTMTKLSFMFSPDDELGNLVPWVCLDDNTVFICGGIHKNEYLTDTYIYNLTRQDLESKADLQQGRILHGLYSYNGLVYAMSGEYLRAPTLTNEAYDIDQGIWTQLPDFPEPGIINASIARLSECLYITGKNSAQIVQYDIPGEVFTVLGFNLTKASLNHKVFTYSESIYVVEDERVHELSENGSKKAEYETADDHATQSWLAGPPIYWANKVFFSGNFAEDNHLYCFDPNEPEVGLFISRYNAFSSVN